MANKESVNSLFSHCCSQLIFFCYQHFFLFLFTHNMFSLEGLQGWEIVANGGDTLMDQQQPHIKISDW